MPIQLTKVAYTTSASARGGRSGHVRSADGLVDFDLAQPGTTPEPAVNPQTLFAAGFAARRSRRMSRSGPARTVGSAWPSTSK